MWSKESQKDFDHLLQRETEKPSLSVKTSILPVSNATAIVKYIKDNNAHTLLSHCGRIFLLSHLQPSVATSKTMFDNSLSVNVL